MARRDADDLIVRDAARLWHPYTQHGCDPEPLPVVAADGASLILADGRRILDAISSWWTCLHGHGEPRLVAAMHRQAETLDHVLFAGATHPPAVALAEALVEVAPPGLDRVFFSDDGSTAVEVALKLVYQGHVLSGEPGRSVFVALEHGYHGDTFGAMAAGDPDPFFRSFAPLLFEVRRVPVDADGSAIAEALTELGPRAAGVLVEPLVQGAGGMRMHGAGFLQGARRACDAADIPLIADEVLTGFGRCGDWFACTRAGVGPDVLCLAKGLTGGLVPLSATLVREAWFERFRSGDRSRMLFHGHSFTAWPIGCAVALESLRLCREREVPARLEVLGARIHAGLTAALPHGAPVRDLRRTGGIVAVELEPEDDDGYLARRGVALRARALDAGLLLRPLGDVLYAMPPACLSDTEADRIAAVLAELCS